VAMEAYKAIENHELVVERFGVWPSFHDGEVYRVVLDRLRRNPNGHYYPSVELQIRGWVMTSEVDTNGHYKIKSDSVVHFLFEEVTDLELDGLNHQNVVWSLQIEHSDDGLVIELVPCYGLSGSFKARRGSVVAVIPYEEPQPAY
jgi:hypothetical protein